MRREKFRGLIPEWAPQDAVLLAWPTEKMDWAYMLEEAEQCYRNIVTTLLEYVNVIVLTDTAERVKKHFGQQSAHKLIILDGYELNDTWARDFSPLCVSDGDVPCLVNFGFNAWGLKFPADKDNQVGRWLKHRSAVFNPDIPFLEMQYYVYEGGALESNGDGVILTTSDVYDDGNRSWGLSEKKKKKILLKSLGGKELVVLDVAPMAGDDTDGHIDTMARFVDRETIVFNTTTDRDDINFEALDKLQAGLREAVMEKGMKDTRLVPLPIPAPIMAQEEEDGEGYLPATYANFLITNGAVLVPTYQDPMDAVALEILKGVFPDREVRGIDCRALIRQHGSLHCVTMQFPRGFINQDLLA